MRYCGPQGIAHSDFLQWEQDDQDKAIAWMLGESGKCPSCGTYPTDWLDEDGKELEAPPFSASTLLCVGCKTIAAKQEDIPEEGQRWYHVFLHRRTPDQKG